MFCSKCGTDHPDDSRFCRKCGQTLGVVSTGGGAAAAPARIAIPAKPKSRFTYWHYVALLILVFIGGTWYIQNMKGHALPLPEQATRPQLHTQTTGDKAFTVPAGSTNSFIFDVPSGAYNVSIKGRYSATGGSGNDIDALLLTADDYVNWQNGHTFHPLYNSGQVTQETVNVKLPDDAGKYYFIFNNKFSLLTPKAVQANLAMTCYTR